MNTFIFLACSQNLGFNVSYGEKQKSLEPMEFKVWSRFLLPPLLPLGLLLPFLWVLPLLPLTVGS